MLERTATVQSNGHRPEGTVLRDSAGGGTRRQPLHAVEVGAGPYGLATAAHLAAHGLSVRTVGEPMESWRRSDSRLAV